MYSLQLLANVKFDQFTRTAFVSEYGFSGLIPKEFKEQHDKWILYLIQLFGQVLPDIIHIAKKVNKLQQKHGLSAHEILEFEIALSEGCAPVYCKSL